jgi:hypothetical protein
MTLVVAGGRCKDDGGGTRTVPPDVVGCGSDDAPAATTEVPRGLDSPSRPPGPGEADGGRTAGNGLSRPVAPIPSATGAQHRLARLSQERILALGVVALLVMLSGVGAGMLARRGDERPDRLAAERPLTTQAHKPGSPPAKATTTTAPGETTTTGDLTPAVVGDEARTPSVTSRNQTVATPRPGGAGFPPARVVESGGAGPSGPGASAPRGGADGGERGAPVVGPGLSGAPVFDHGSAPGADPGPVATVPPWGPLGPCHGPDYLPIVELSSVGSAFHIDETIAFNVGVRNVGNHECGPPPLSSLVVTTDDGTPVEIVAVDWAFPPDTHLVPSESVRQLASWKPPRTGAFRVQLQVDGERSNTLPVLVE